MTASPTADNLHKTATRFLTCSTIATLARAYSLGCRRRASSSAPIKSPRGPEPKILPVGMFRDRWRYKNHYTEDLIAYAMRPSLLGQAIQKVSADVRGLPLACLSRNSPGTSRERL
jgi:hypothetical protein